MADAEDGAVDVPAPRPDGRQARWANHNSERRRRIVDAAIDVITDEGYAGELHVQQIAQRAGLSRTVIYRHFSDRADLDDAIQGEIIRRLWSRLQPEVRLEGTVPEIIERIIGTYVQWAVEHPALHRMADYDSRPDGPLERALEEISGQVASMIAFAVVGLGGHPSEDQTAALDPLVYGLVGAVFGAVRRWLARSERVLTPDALVQLTSRSAWFAIDGHARDFGVVIDPTKDVEELIAEAIAG